MPQPTQSGTFVGGLVSGFQTGNQIQANQAQRKRQKQQFEAQQELQEIKTEASKIELKNAKAQQRRNKALRQLDTAVQAKEAGNTDLAVEEFVGGLENLDVNKEDFAPETFRALNTLERAATNPGEVENQQVIDAANVAFGSALNKGDNQTTTPDGRNVTITDRKIDKFRPTPNNGSRGEKPGVFARLRITGETDDGEQVSFTKPLTKNRSSDPNDPAVGVPIDEIVDNIQGRKMLLGGLAQSPKFRDLIQLARTRAGGEKEQADFGTQEIKRGDQIVTFLTEDGVPTEPLAEAPRFKQEAAQGGGPVGGPGGELQASDENSMFRQAASLFGGTFNPRTGRIAGLQSGTESDVQAVASRASELFVQGDASTRSVAVRQAANELGLENEIKDLGPRQSANNGQGGNASGGLPNSSQNGGPRQSNSQSSQSGSRGQNTQNQPQDDANQIEAFGQQAVEQGADPQVVRDLQQRTRDAINRGKSRSAALELFQTAVRSHIRARRSEVQSGR